MNRTTLLCMLALPILYLPLQAGVEDRCSVLIDSLLLQAPADFAGKHLAVLPFSGQQDQTGQQGTSIAEFIINMLQKRKACVLIDRITFQKALQEIALSQTGIIADSTALQVGKFSAADYVLTGTIAPVFGKMRISAKIIKTETAEIISSASVTVLPGELENYSRELFGEAGQMSAALFRSVVIPGWGQYYTNQPVRGTIALVACFGSLAYTGVTVYQRATTFADYTDYHNYLYTPAMIADRDRRVLESGKTVAEVNAEFEQRDASLYADYSNRHNQLVIMSVVTGVLWAANIVDAAIAGNQNKKKFDLYFSGSLENVTIGVAVNF